MHVMQNCYAADGGVNNLNAAIMLQHWMGAILGGRWQVTDNKYGYAAGSAVEVHAAMVEDTLVAAWVCSPTVVDVYSDNTASIPEPGR